MQGNRGGQNSKAKRAVALVALSAYFVGNFFLLLYLFQGLYQLTIYDSQSLKDGFAIFSTIVGFAYLQRLTYWYFNFNIGECVGVISSKKLVVGLGNLAILLFAVILNRLIVPAFSEHNFELGERAYQGGLYATALDHFDRSLSQNPGLNKNHLALGRVYEAISNSDKAIEHYQLGMATIDRRYSAYNDLARIYMENEKNYIKALNLLTKIKQDLEADTTQVLKKEESYGVILKNLAWVYYQLGLYEDSFRNAQESVDILMPIQGALQRNPGVYCIYALNTLKSAAEKYSLPIAEKCIENAEHLQGAETELYVELKTTMENRGQ